MLRVGPLDVKYLTKLEEAGRDLREFSRAQQEQTEFSLDFLGADKQCNAINKHLFLQLELWGNHK